MEARAHVRRHAAASNEAYRLVSKTIHVCTRCHVRTLRKAAKLEAHSLELDGEATQGVQAEPLRAELKAAQPVHPEHTLCRRRQLEVKGCATRLRRKRGMGQLASVKVR